MSPARWAALAVAAAIATPVALALTRPGDVDEPGPEPAHDRRAGSTFHDPAHRFRVKIPAGWQRARYVVIPEVTNPREILVVSTFPPDGFGEPCGPFYDHVLSHMGSSEGLVAVQERLGHEVAGPRVFPPRPAHFRLPPRRPKPRGCGRKGDRRPVRDWWIPFRSAGRDFYAQVALGPRAPNSLRRDARELLDSLRAERGPADVVGRRTSFGALPAAPPAITKVCAEAAPRAAFPVLCPARWPPPAGRGAPKPRAFEKASDVYLIDVANGFGRRGGHVFHLLVGGQRRPFGRWPAGVDPDLRITTRKVLTTDRAGVLYLPARRIATARVHGVKATVLREPPYPQGGLHGGHVVVLWSEDGHGYLVSVHGERLPRRALVSIALAMARSTRPSPSVEGTSASVPSCVGGFSRIVVVRLPRPRRRR
jgi:hypothetical protein